MQLNGGSFKCDGNNNECGRRYTLTESTTHLMFGTQNHFFESYAKIQSAKAAYKDVLSDVGQNMPILDEHDTRVINEVKTGSYKYTGSKGKPPRNT